MPRMFMFLLAVVVTWQFPAFAQVPDQFDTSRTMTIKGTVAQFAVNPGHSYLLIETKDATGNAETWAVRGNGLTQLMQSGWKIKPPDARIGDTVAVLAFAPKSTGAPLDVPEGVSERVAAAAKTGRFAHGIDVTFTNGVTLPFGPRK